MLSLWSSVTPPACRMSETTLLCSVCKIRITEAEVGAKAEKTETDKSRIMSATLFNAAETNEDLCASIHLCYAYRVIQISPFKRGNSLFLLKVSKQQNQCRSTNYNPSQKIKNTK